MKTQHSKKQEQEPVIPNWKESEFAKTIEGQVMLMIDSSLENGSFIEASTLSWAAIEQILLPRLIGWISKIHKLDLPAEAYKQNAQSINFLYLTFSHDIDLFNKLEQARIKRNEIIHKLTKLGDEKSIKKSAKESTRVNMLLQQEIMKRFDGRVPIPSINLYRSGWNDALQSVIRRYKNELEELESSN